MTPLQLDLATVVARLEQLDRIVSAEVTPNALAFLLWRRVIDCDVPRLRGHLEPETLAELAAVQR